MEIERFMMQKKKKKKNEKKKTKKTEKYQRHDRENGGKEKKIGESERQIEREIDG